MIQLLLSELLMFITLETLELRFPSYVCTVNMYNAWQVSTHWNLLSGLFLFFSFCSFPQGTDVFCAICSWLKWETAIHVLERLINTSLAEWTVFPSLQIAFPLFTSSALEHPSSPHCAGVAGFCWQQECYLRSDSESVLTCFITKILSLLPCLDTP